MPNLRLTEQGLRAAFEDAGLTEAEIERELDLYEANHLDDDEAAEAADDYEDYEEPKQ